MKNINHIKKHIQAAFILLLLFTANLTFAQINLVNSPYWKAISTSKSGQSTAVIPSDGTLWVWGHGASGQLGLGTTDTNNPTPQQVIINKTNSPTAEDNDWAYVSQGATFILAIKTDGTLWGAGNQANGVLGNGVTSGTLTAITKIGTDTDWKYIAAGSTHTIALKTDGTLWAWGAGGSGQLGNGGSAVSSTPVQIGTDTDWEFINTGAAFSAAIKTDGSLYTWGNNAASGLLGIGENGGTKNTPQKIGTDTWSYVALASNHGIGMKTDGSVYSWGHPQHGRLADGQNRAATTANPGVLSPTLIPNTTGNTYTIIAAADRNSYLLKDNNELWGAGDTFAGQLGNGEVAGEIKETYLVRVGGDNSLWTSVITGHQTVYAIKPNGTLWSWGLNTRGQLGNGTTDNSGVPVKVLFPFPVPEFEEITTATFTGVNNSSAAWADYDKDGFKDVLVTGKSASAIAGVTRLYKNNGDGTFTSVTHTFPEVTNGELAWADINNDGYPDVVITGTVQSTSNQNNLTKVFINNAGTGFTEVTSTFKSKYNSAVCWLDYNNDGFQDLIIAGANKTSEGGSTSTELYKNNGDGTFTYIPLPVGGTTTFQGVAQAQGIGITAADYNGDGLTDVFIMGNETGGGTARLYKNMGNDLFQEVTGHGITGTYRANTKWVDYDNDGYPDIVIAGQEASNVFVTKLYKNNGGNGTFTFVSTATFDAVVNGGRIETFDYNGDGLIDIMTLGNPNTGGNINAASTLYKNNGDGTFTKVTGSSLGLLNADYGSIALADFDNDGNPDILLTGTIPNTGIDDPNYGKSHIKLYKNNWAGIANTNIPADLTGTLASTTSIKFDWSNAAGATKYYLRIGTSSGAGDVVNGLNPVTTGTGNPLTGTFAINKTLVQDETYYWSVRTENASLNLSDWAPEQTFTVDFGTLPVTLVSFDAKKEDNRVKLQWVTSAEKDNNRFEVERSTDGKNFSLLTTETARNTAATYTVYDRNPSAGVNYYRLKQIDNDGQVADLGVKVLNFGLLTADIRLYPNPVVNQTLYVDFGKAKGQAVRLKLADITGKVIYEQNLNAAQTQDAYSLTLPTAVKAGYYLLNINGSNINYSNKIIVR